MTEDQLPRYTTFLAPQREGEPGGWEIFGRKIGRDAHGFLQVVPNLSLREAHNITPRQADPHPLADGKQRLDPDVVQASDSRIAERAD